MRLFEKIAKTRWMSELNDITDENRLPFLKKMTQNSSDVAKDVFGAAALAPSYVDKEEIIRDAKALRTQLFSNNRTGDELGRVSLSERLSNFKKGYTTMGRFRPSQKTNTTFDNAPETLPEKVPVMGITGENFLNDFKKNKNDGVSLQNTREGNGSGLWVHHANGENPMENTGLSKRDSFYASRVLRHFDRPVKFQADVNKEHLLKVPNIGYESMLSSKMPEELKNSLISSTPYTEREIYSSYLENKPGFFKKIEGVLKPGQKRIFL